MLSDDEILRRLEVVRRSSQHERNARRATSINSLASQVGVSRVYLYNLLKGTAKLSHPAKQKLSQALTCNDIAGIRHPVTVTTPSIEIRFSVEKWLN